MLDFRNLRVIIFSFFISLVLYLPAYSQPFAYITDYFGSENVCKVDLLTNTEAAVIPVNCINCEPYWIAASADQNLVAASLHTSDGIALIDALTMTHIGNVAGVGGEPEAIAVNSTGTTVYVADEGGDTLFVVDAATQMVVTGPIDLDPGPPFCSEPENMVISPDNSTLYITCAGSSVISVNTANFAISQIATGLNDPHGIAINPAGTLLYYTDGTDVIQYSIATGMPTGITYLGCDMQNGAISPGGDRLYCVEENDNLFIYTTATGALVQMIDLGTSTARGVAVSPDGARAFVPFGNELKVVDTTTFAVTEIALTCTDARDIVIAQKIFFINLSPPTATNIVGTDHTVTATVVDMDGIPEPGVLVTFEVTFGPNAGQVSDPNTGECTPNDDCTTDGNGQVSWTYTGSGIPGTDTIVASFFDISTQTVMESNTVAKIWERPINIPTLSEWGLIAMAGVLGIIGLLAIRRRKVTA